MARRPSTLDPPLHHSLTIVGRSDVGRVRQRNEDSFSVDADLGVAVVADGMGGHPGGDVASRIAADTAAAILAEAIEEARTPDSIDDGASIDDEDSTRDEDFIGDFRAVMEEAVLEAHRKIRQKGAAEPRLDGMGTTLTAMVVHTGTGAWVIGHVGDSRAYRLADGHLHQLTRDDTWIQERIDQGDMQPESARLSPYAHLLTQCLGLEDTPTIHLIDGRAESGDLYLLCTDGLVGMLEDDEVAEILRAPDGADALDRLIEEANEAGGHDNITAAIVRI